MGNGHRHYTAEATLDFADDIAYSMTWKTSADPLGQVKYGQRRSREIPARNLRQPQKWAKPEFKLSAGMPLKKYLASMPDPLLGNKRAEDSSGHLLRALLGSI